MGNIRYWITGGFSENEMEQICDEAIIVLRDVGVEIDHQGILELLREHRGVNVKDSRVAFEPDLVKRYIEKFRGEYTADESEGGSEHLTMSGPYSGLLILDMESGEFRTPTSSDFIDSIKLHEGLGVEHRGVPAVIPRDIPDRMRALATFKIGCENTSGDVGNTPLFSYEEAKFLHEMEEAVGRRANMSVQFIVSPLKFDHVGLDIVYRSIVDGDFLVSGSAEPIPLAGATAPLFVPGCFVLAIAESLAGAICMRLISGERMGHFSLRVDPFDMKYATMSIGSPEWILFRLMGRGLHRHLFPGVKLRGAFRTLSKEPDSQAAAERALSVFVEALDGSTSFYGGGQMSVDEIYSPEQLVIDVEILRYVEHVTRGFEFKGEGGLSVDVIREVGPGGTYLTHPSTLQNMREMYWEPKLFEHWMVGRWRSAGSKTVRERAREVAKDAMAEREKHEYHPDEDVKEELDRIYRAAEEALLR